MKQLTGEYEVVLMASLNSRLAKRLKARLVIDDAYAYRLEFVVKIGERFKTYDTLSKAVRAYDTEIL